MRNFLFVVLIIIMLLLTACNMNLYTSQEGQNIEETFNYIESPIEVTKQFTELNIETEELINDLTEEITSLIINTTEETVSSINDAIEESLSENDETTEYICNAELTSWIGEYHSSEFFEPNQSRKYVICIYQENEKILVKISIDGYMTYYRINGHIEGDETKIHIIFDENTDSLFENMYEKGDVLLSLERKEGELITEWKKLQPLYIEFYVPQFYQK